MKAQVFVASYAKDFPWLEHLLFSLKKFGTGFLPPVVCVASEDYAGALAIVAKNHPGATVQVKDGRPGQGFMLAQIAMMSCDLLCPEADFVFLLGSDCAALGPFSPEPFFDGSGRPHLWFQSWESMGVGSPPEKAWRAGTERALGFGVRHEYMRRLPIVYPTILYPCLRHYLEHVHQMGFEDYIYTQDAKTNDISESNLLGAFAHRLMPWLFSWCDLSSPGAYEAYNKLQPNPIFQAWSHGGLDYIIDRDCEYAPGKTTKGTSARKLFNEILYAKPHGTEVTP